MDPAETPPAIEETPASTHPRAGIMRRAIRAMAAIFLLAAIGLAGGYFWLDTQSGKNFVISRIEALEPENGMRIGIGRIEGSIYRDLLVEDLTLSDPQGVFLTIPQVQIDWRPLRYLWGHVDIRALSAPEMVLERWPEFNEVADDDAPLLPDLDIDIGRLSVEQITISKAITGRAHVASLTGRASIADRRAQIFANATAVPEGARAGGDTLQLHLDAVPQDNVLSIDARVDAPADGLLAWLGGFDAPLAATLAGKGDWAAWQGRFDARLGTRMLADLALRAADGTFAISGNSNPGLMIEGAAGKLFEPVTMIDIGAAMDQRVVTLDGTIGSSSFHLDSAGRIDLGTSRFDDLAVDVQLIRPGQLTSALGGQAIAAKLALNGAFSAPEAAYEITAERLTVQSIGLVGVAMQGDVTTDRKGGAAFSLTGAAQRADGVGSAAQFLNDLKITGDFALADGRLSSDNLEIRSSRANADGSVLADWNSGQYSGTVNGQIGDYAIENIGLFDLESKIAITASDNAPIAVNGTLQARSTTLSSAGLRGFLGGNMQMLARFSYGANGLVKISSMAGSAPQFRLDRGSGTYAGNGALKFSAAGYSAQYGPMAMGLAGSFESPVAVIDLSRPGMGIGLASVRATVRANPGGYAILATGQSDYGPLGASLDMLSGAGPVTLDVRRATFAGIALAGRLQQSEQGPFSGRLTGLGNNFEGAVALSPFNGVQRVKVDALARNSTLGQAGNLAFGRAIIDADMIFSDVPQIDADIQLADARFAGTTIARARAQIDYRGGSGNAKLIVEGRGSVPFRVVGNAKLRPNMWLVAANGRANGIDFATAGPMRIVPSAGQYQILPATINLAKGNVKFSGNYGDRMDINARFDDVGLAILNPMLPGLGIAGTASGTAHWQMSSALAFPEASIRLKIANFTRSTFASTSTPMDMDLTARLQRSGGNAQALLKRGGSTIGQMQIDLGAAPSGRGDWVEQLLASRLSGGVRYSGPSDVLFALTTLPDQHLRGPIAIAADMSGRVGAPRLSGAVRADNLTYENDSYGTRLSRLRVRGTFTGDRLNVSELSAVAGNGTVSGKGMVSLSAEQGFPVQLDLALDNARLANRNDMAADVSGTVAVASGTGAPDTPDVISGRLTFPETHYRIQGYGKAGVATLSGVRRKSAGATAGRISGDPDPIESLPSRWNIDLRLVAANKVFITGMGMDSEWAADLKISGTTDAPQIDGQVNLVRGTLDFAGRTFKLERGRITINGADIANPYIDIAASSTIDGVTIQVNMAGSGNKPTVNFSSSPGLPQDEIMARILFGNSMGELSALQAAQLAASLNSLRSGGAGLDPLGVLQSATGIDRIRIVGPDEATGRGSGVAVGQYITNDVYVEIVTDSRGYTASQLEISLSRVLSILGQVGSFGESNINLKFRKNY